MKLLDVEAVMTATTLGRTKEQFVAGAVKRTLIRFLEKDWRRVYFIQSGHDGPVKIGISSRPGKRFEDLQVANPNELRLLGLMFGGRTMEMALHKRFATARLRGEWFSPVPDLMQLIAEIQR